MYPFFYTIERMLRKIYNSLFNKKVKARKLFLSSYCRECAKDLELKEVNYIHPVGALFIGKGSKLLCWDTYSSGHQPQTLEPSLVIGTNFHATRNLTIQCAGQTTIGNDVLVASDVFIIDYNHGIDPSSPSYLDNQLEVSEVVIEDGVWIGNNVIILPGVHIGKKAIIGAGSVVTKDIPSYSIAVGNPARVVKFYDFHNRRWTKATK